MSNDRQGDVIEPIGRQGCSPATHGGFVCRLSLCVFVILVALSQAACRAPYVSWSERTREQNRSLGLREWPSCVINFRVGGQQSEARGQSVSCPTVMFVHGAGASMHVWQHIAPVFTRDYRVVLIDLLGSGQSSIPGDDVPLTMKTQGGVIRELMDHLGGESWYLVGLSYGGGSVLEAARQDRLNGAAGPVPRNSSGRIKGLVVVGAPAFHWTLSPAQQQLDQPLVRCLIPFTSPERIARGITASSMSQIENASEGMVLELADDLSRDVAREALVRRLSEIRRELEGRRGDADYFSAVRCPVLLLWGSEDTVVPLEVFTKLTQRLPDVWAAEVFEGSGHSIFKEMPGRSIRHILDFLQAGE